MLPLPIGSASRALQAHWPMPANSSPVKGADAKITNDTLFVCVCGPVQKEGHSQLSAAGFPRSSPDAR